MSTEMLNDTEKNLFQEAVWDFYRQYGRHDLPWRRPASDGSFDPYIITVSEIMLQQTQVSRVKPKFDEFMQRFPTLHDLAIAEQGEIIRVWSGLGYNRRARFLHQLAQKVVEQGKFPKTEYELAALPGIGKNTAGAILAYTFNQPTIFIETNIRTVYIHHFFSEKVEVDDREIRELLEATIDKEHPREWYWALMDYGAHLKATIGNLNKVSKHYAKQSAFQGSKRQIRGQVLKLLSQKACTEDELVAQIGDERLLLVLQDLISEGLIQDNAGTFSL